MAILQPANCPHCGAETASIGQTSADTSRFVSCLDCRKGDELIEVYGDYGELVHLLEGEAAHCLWERKQKIGNRTYREKDYDALREWAEALRIGEAFQCRF